MDVIKLLYAPFSIAAGILGDRAGKKAFSWLWSRFSDEPKAAPAAGQQRLVRVAAAAALEAATQAASTAVAKQLAARTFHQLVGAWPEQPAPATADAD